MAKLRACSPEHLLKKAMSEEHRVLPVATLLDGIEVNNGGTKLP